MAKVFARAACGRSLLVLVAMLGAGYQEARAAGLDPHQVRAREMHNAALSVTWTPKIAFQPGTDIEELSRTIKWIRTNYPDLDIRAGGSRHSNSPVASTLGAYIHPEGIKFIERVKHGASAGVDLKSDANDAYLYRIGSGTTIREINAKLWSEKGALAALGGYDGQTLGGVLTTGTHGSVLARGPLAEMVQSIDLVTAEGAKIRMEPHDGLTDRTSFAKTHPGWRLIQADDYFDSALISMGTLGITHSYVVRARERFWMNEARTTSMTRGNGQTKILRSDVVASLKNGNIYRMFLSHELLDGERPKGSMNFGGVFQGHPTSAFHMEFLWNPYDDRMLITSRNPVFGQKRVEFERKEPAEFEGIPNREMWRTFFTPAELNRPWFTELVTQKVFAMPVVKSVVVVIKNRVAKAIKGGPVAAIDAVLDGLPDPVYFQRSYNVFNIGWAANSVPAQSADISVPLRGDKYLRAMEILSQTAKNYARDTNKYQTAPISMRFVKGSRAILGDPEDVCKFEILFSGDDQASRDLAKEMVTVYYRALEKEFGAEARFHWGQLIPQEVIATYRKHIPASFPRYGAYKRVRDELDPKRRLTNPWLGSLLP